MYEHPDCVFTDLAAVQRYLDGRNIEIIAGDIACTCRRLHEEDLVLTFIDTDNYTPAQAAIEVARERTVPGGAIVFDHFTGNGRFRYTLGERSPLAYCSVTPDGFVCTTRVCSTVRRPADEAAARATGPDLRPVLVLRFRAPAHVRTACGG